MERAVSWTRYGELHNQHSLYRALVIKIGEYPVSLPVLTEMDLSQNTDPLVITEDSLGFLEKDVSPKFYICSAIIF